METRSMRRQSARRLRVRRCAQHPTRRNCGRVNEGQVVLTNGMNVGHRAGTPSAPARSPPEHSLST